MLERLRREEMFGEPLHVIAHGPVPIEAAIAGTVALASDGTAVLIVWLEEPGRSSAADLTDHLDLLATMGPEELVALSQSSPPPSAGGDDSRPEGVEPFPQIQGRAFNRHQKAIVIVQRQLDTSQWKTLLIEVGRKLGGVYVRTPGGLEPQDPPPELLRTAAMPVRRAIYAIAVVVAMALSAGAGGFVATSRMKGRSGVVVQDASATRTVAVDVPFTATNGEWIGQQRIVRTSAGRLVIAYPTSDGIAITSDAADQGRTWEQPTILAGLDATSLSIAIDESDNLHVAFFDPDRGTRYISLIQGRTRHWGASAPVTLDPGPTTPVVDIAYDPRAGVAHVLWSRRTPRGEQPHWAAVALREKDPSVVDTRPLARAVGTDTVLGNVEALSDSSVLATYRTGEGKVGWNSRTANLVGSRSWRWEPSQVLPTDSYIGAASLVVDDDDTAHLILRDSSTFQLLHFFKRKDEPWSSGVTALDAERTEEIDYPSLSIDATSDLLYVFFQHDVVDAPPEIRFILRDPNGQWDGPFAIPGASDATFPTVLPSAASAAFLAWTSTVDVSEMRAKMILPP